MSDEDKIVFRTDGQDRTKDIEAAFRHCEEQGIDMAALATNVVNAQQIFTGEPTDFSSHIRAAHHVWSHLNLGEGKLLFKDGGFEFEGKINRAAAMFLNWMNTQVGAPRYSVDSLGPMEDVIRVVEITHGAATVIVPVARLQAFGFATYLGDIWAQPDEEYVVKFRNMTKEQYAQININKVTL